MGDAQPSAPGRVYLLPWSNRSRRLVLGRARHAAKIFKLTHYRPSSECSSQIQPSAQGSSLSLPLFRAQPLASSRQRRLMYTSHLDIQQLTGLLEQGWREVHRDRFPSAAGRTGHHHTQPVRAWIMSGTQVSAAVAMRWVEQEAGRVFLPSRLPSQLNQPMTPYSANRHPKTTNTTR
jgi:hypothetical protein